MKHVGLSIHLMQYHVMEAVAIFIIPGLNDYQEPSFMIHAIIAYARVSCAV